MRATAFCLLLSVIFRVYAFIPGADGPVSSLEAIEGGSATLHCDSTTDSAGDELMLLVWYRNNAPIFSYDTRVETAWTNPTFNIGGRLKPDLSHQPSSITIGELTDRDQALYHCRVDFLVAPTRNIGVNLTVIVLPSQPFFLDELGNKVKDKIGPYHDGDTLVLSCLVIGGRPPPRISWYSGQTLVDASDGASDIPSVRENELYLPLTRDNAESLTCRASNTHLSPPIEASLQIELYLPAYNVSIYWVEGTIEDVLQAGKPAVVKCTAHGAYPQPDLSWWLDHRHLTQHSNQSWSNTTRTSVSFLQLMPTVLDAGATLACVATNSAMAPSRGSKADILTLNVTYSPIVEVSRLGDGSLTEVVELDSLQLECEVKANPPVERFIWYFNDSQIISGGIWGEEVHSQRLSIEEATRRHTGPYSCAAGNAVGETRAEHINITVHYPPECAERGLVLIKEAIRCNVRSLPAPDTFFWHVQPSGSGVQHLTTSSPILTFAQITGPLSETLKATCEASNGVASQDQPCARTFGLEQLRPPPPRRCDLAYEHAEFHIRCMPVENATYYELSVWRLTPSNSSLVLERRGSMGFGSRQALVHGGEEWIVRGGLGDLGQADEAGASACNRYGCSEPLLLRPTENLLMAASPPWWHFVMSKDVGISLGAAVLVAVFLISTALFVRLARRPHGKGAPVIQVLQLDDITRNYIDNIAETLKATCEASNGVASQDQPCARTFGLEQLRPPPPRRCDLAYEHAEFHIRCMPVENATYYELSVWRLTPSNSSLVLERRGSMGFGSRQALVHGGEEWIVRGGLGDLGQADEAGASACNRYGCSEPLLLRPTENLLMAASPPWWHFVMSKDVGISLGAAVLVAVFLISTALFVRLARRPHGKGAPVIQVLQLDDITRNYIDNIAENKVRASCSLRSCSSGYSDGSALEEHSAPSVDRRRKPQAIWEHWDAPPPDVTIREQRESAV